MTVDRRELAGLVAALSEARVVGVGDVMLDRYVEGGVGRISPEAPIPVLRVEAERAMPGGAGNVLANLAALGARTGFVSVVGDDVAGAELTRRLEAVPRSAAVPDPDDLARSLAHHPRQQIDAFNDTAQVVLWRTLQQAHLHVHRKNDVHRMLSRQIEC